MRQALLRGIPLPDQALRFLTLHWLTRSLSRVDLNLEV